MHPLGLLKRSSGCRNGGPALIVEFPRFRTHLFDMFMIAILMSECGEFSRNCFFFMKRRQLMGGFQMGTGDPDPPPWKITKNRVPKHTGPVPFKIRSYQASIRCWTISRPHLNGVSLVGQWWPANSGVWNQLKKRCQSWTTSDKTFCSWVIMFYVRSPLSCAKAPMCYPTFKTTTARVQISEALILDIMLSLRLWLYSFVCGWQY